MVWFLSLRRGVLRAERPVETRCLSSTASVSAGRRIQGQKILWWEGQKGLAFLQDVQLVDGELVVPRPGLYYVYAQTYFRHTHSVEDEEDGDQEDGEVEDRGRPLLQYVYKKVGELDVEHICRHQLIVSVSFTN